MNLKRFANELQHIKYDITVLHEELKKTTLVPEREMLRRAYWELDMTEKSILELTGIARETR